MKGLKVLVCDDDKSIAEALQIYLKQEGLMVHKAYDGLEALELLKKEVFHLVILDIMIPRLDGLSTAVKIRDGYNIPIIMLSAKSEDTDKIAGLNFGADDYVTKPFNPLELMARVKSQLRRYTTLGNMTIPKSLLKTGGLEMNRDTKEVTVDGEPIRVTATEYRILEFLMMNMGFVYSIEQIYENVWNEPAYMCTPENTVAVHIRHIREKIEINPKEPKYLKVVWGIGYKIEKI